MRSTTGTHRYYVLSLDVFSNACVPMLEHFIWECCTEYNVIYQCAMFMRIVWGRRGCGRGLSFSCRLNVEFAVLACVIGLFVTGGFQGWWL